MDALLSAELRSRHGLDGYNSASANAAILPPRAKKRARVPEAGGARTVPVRLSTRAARRGSKSRARKLVSVVVNHEKKAQRGEHYAALAASSLTREQQGLLAKSGALGGALSAKASLSLQLKRQRAGLEASDAFFAPPAATKNSTLLRAREGGGGGGEEEGDEDEEGGEDDSAEEEDDEDADDDEEEVEDGEGDDGEEGGEDEDEEDEDEEDEEEEDEEEEEEAEGAKANSAAAPSAFAFKVSLSGARSAPVAAAPAPLAPLPPPPPLPAQQPPQAPADLASESLGRRFVAGKEEQRIIDAGGQAAEGQQQGAGAGAGGALRASGSKRRLDGDTLKLLELRERNARERAGLVAPLAAEEGAGSGSGEGGGALRASLPGNSAYLATDAWSESEGESSEGGEAAGAGAGTGKRSGGAGKVEAEDEGERAAREHAAAALVRSQGGALALPASSYSAYSPTPVVLARRAGDAAARGELPVVRLEQEIMEAAGENDVVIVSGETGSGKTTQVPQFFLEAGYGMPASAIACSTAAERAAAAAAAAAPPGAAAKLASYRPHAVYRGIPGMVAVTQPRRLAAIAMAARVGGELKSPLGGGGGGSRAGLVGYAVRFDSRTCGAATRLKFLTDGLLLREMAGDFLLRQYSCIIVDEAHERGVNTDLLLGLLSRALPLRNALARAQAEALWGALARDPGAAPPRPGSPDAPLPPLKLVIMSATLRLEDFTGAAARAVLFPTLPRAPPVIHVRSRQFPVTVHFSKTTELADYVGAAVAKVCRIHGRLPEGGILVFLTGQAEVEQMCAALEERLGRAAIRRAEKAAERAAAAAAAEAAAGGAGGAAEPPPPPPKPPAPVHVLPLYALLPREAQDRVFSTPAPGVRRIVVATNVAETSITIPGIRYVVDSGRVKRKIYHAISGSSRFEVGWISQASAAQRAGRAGRTGPGHAYRMYSSAIFSQRCAVHEPPEIASTPLPALVLTLKAMGIECAASFPFPTPPPPAALLGALRSLTNLGALVPTLRQGAGRGGGAAQPLAGASLPSLAAVAEERLTPLGALLARLPLHPPLAKTLVLAWQAQRSAREQGRGGGGGGGGGAAAAAAAAAAHDIFRHALLLVAAITVENLLHLPSGAPPLPGKGGGRGGGAAEEAGARDSAAADSAGGAGAGAADEEDGFEDPDELLESAGSAGKHLAALTRDHPSAAAAAAAAAAAEGADSLSPEARAAQERCTAARSAAQAAHARLRHPLSDALTLLTVAGAYTHGVSASGAAPAKLCRDLWLRPKAMAEVAALALQLERTLEEALGAADGGSGGESGSGSGRGREEGGGAVRLPLVAASGGDAEEEVEVEVEGGAEAGQGEEGAAAAAAAGAAAAGSAAAGAATAGAKAPAAAAAAAKARAPPPRAPPAAPAARAPLAPPSPHSQTLLRQFLASGFIENIAKRPPPQTAAALCAAARVPWGSSWTPYVPASAAMAAGIRAGSAAALAAAEANMASGGAKAEEAAMAAAVAAAAAAAGEGSGSAAAAGSSSSAGAPSLPACLWVHPHSAVYSADPELMPACITFTACVFGKGGRAYARCVTAVEEGWLPLLAGGTPLLAWGAPLPGSALYDARADAVCAAFTPVFGDAAWRLKPVPRPLWSSSSSAGGAPADAGGAGSALDASLRHFARAVLEGVAVPGMARWGEALSAPPSALTRVGAPPSLRAMQLLAALERPWEAVRGRGGAGGGGGGGAQAAQPVLSRAALARVWRSSPGYLAEELSAWVREGSARDFAAAWPALVAGFLAGEEEGGE